MKGTLARTTLVAALILSGRQNVGDTFRRFGADWLWCV